MIPVVAMGLRSHFLKCVLPNVISVVSATAAFVCLAAIILGGAYDGKLLIRVLVEVDAAILAHCVDL